ncbi:MAG: hypothetical protein NVSMB29_00630 [Candidatus Dormibacteria bacterium]
MPGRTLAGRALEEELMRSRVAPPPLFTVADVHTAPSPPRPPAPVIAAQAPARPVSGRPSLDTVRGALSEIAHARLGRSATRVDELLTRAAREGHSLATAIGQVRGLSIRGVMPATMRLLADELEEVALRGYPGIADRAQPRATEP